MPSDAELSHATFTRRVGWGAGVTGGMRQEKMPANDTNGFRDGHMGNGVNGNGVSYPRKAVGSGVGNSVAHGDNMV